MQNSKNRISTTESTTGLPSDIAFFTVNQESKCVNLYVQMPIDCQTYKQVSFVTKMVKCLCSNAFFIGTAHLEQPQSISDQVRLRYNKEAELRSIEPFFSQYRICYKSAYSLGPSQPQGGKQKLQSFREKCFYIHSRLSQYNTRYRIENRVDYWLYLMRAQIGKFLGEKSVVRCEMDQPLKLFDSS